MSSTDPKQTSGNIYRSTRRPLFEEPESMVDERCSSFRVSARYSLDSWSEERDRDPHDLHPDRTENASRVDKPKPVTKREPLANLQGCQKVWKDEELSAKTTNGVYSFLEIGPRGILARCTGPRCNGSTRWIPRYIWMAGTIGACITCAQVIRRAEEFKRKEASANHPHGKYEFVRFEMRKSNSTSIRAYGTATVIGRCTGPRCGGHERSFSLTLWNDVEGEGKSGCNLCSQLERGHRAGEAGLAHFTQLHADRLARLEQETRADAVRDELSWKRGAA